MHRAVRHAAAAALALLWLTTPTRAQQGAPDLAGMWSDPTTIEDTFCIFFCTDAGLERLEQLLDDERNDDRPIVELYGEAAAFQRDEYLHARLTPAATATLGIDPADDPGFLECEPWAFAREIFAPHQLQVEQYADRVELLYGEWTVRRTVYLDGRGRPTGAPSSAMGHSVGRYESGALVIETTGISANLAPWGVGFPLATVFDGRHSEQLRAVERYTRTDDGERLLMSVTLEDPWALREPVVLKKVWQWAPEQEIAPYDDCKPPTEFSRGVTP